MDSVSDATSKRQFEGFAAGASDSLLRTGYLMTGASGTPRTWSRRRSCG